MATVTSFGNMLNQKATSGKVKKEADSSSQPKNLKELREMAKKKIASKKRTIKKKARK